VTRYEMIMPAGISVRKILGYDNDIAMTLEARGSVRIEAPIPGKNAVGIEVPNTKSATIGFKEVFESGEFEANKNPLNFVLGKDINGKFIFCNLAKAPHLLVAGSTGSGKSVCLNILILSIIYKSSPEDVRLVLVDPKRVEFAIYEGLPHLMLPNIITEPEKAVNAFTWAINEMEKRYTLFQSHKVKDINDYNQLPDIVNKKKPKMPYIVMIVDELADLMSVCKREIEEKIARIAAKARAAGIHLVLATQRPSTDVITGTIKNNFPTRIAFSLTSYADSKTILDQSGAERLLGRGDMLYAPQDQNVNTRIQAPFVTGQEISQIVEYVKAHNDSNYEDNIVNKMLNKGGESSHDVGVKDPTQDEMFVPALRTVIENNQASSSLLQRKLGVGWNRASKLTDALEDMGYISRPDSNNKRQILITKEQFRELYGDID
ncbi:MAG: DNA translocase FtsK, partial [Christensenellales bacterium]